jgi:hypothetical protein
MAFRVSRSRVYGDGQMAWAHVASVRLAPARHVFRCDSAMSNQGRWGEDPSAKAAGCRSRPTAAAFKMSCGGHSDRSGRSGRDGFLWLHPARATARTPIFHPSSSLKLRMPPKKSPKSKLDSPQVSVGSAEKPSSPESRNGDFTLRIQIPTIRRCWWLSQLHCAGAATSLGPPGTGRSLIRRFC